MSLRWKILAWFFVNLAVAGLLASGFILVQFRIGMSSLLAGSTDDRLEAIAQPLAADLHRQPADQWSAALDRATAIWRSRGLQVGLFRHTGEFLAGDFQTLPAEVSQELARHEALRRRGPPRPRDGPGGPPPRPPNRGDPRERLDGAARDRPGGPGEDRPPEPPLNGFDANPGPRMPPPAPEIAPGGGGGRLDKFMLVAGTPRLYWTGVYLGEVPRPERRGPGSGVTLVIASTSLSGGGLFFDYKPWLLLAIALILISVLWWLPLVRGLTLSLSRMTDVAEEIARGQFRPPAPSPRRDELGRLGRALGHMSARLEGYVTGQKRFLGDTAHELLSPLGRLEVALSILEAKTEASADRRYVEQSLAEVRQMSRLVNDLMAYTKAGLRAQAAELQPTAVGEIARRAVAQEGAEGIVIVQVPEDCRVSADPILLARALANGVRNALRYAREAGPITITAVPAAPLSTGDVEVSVRDQGPGVPADAIARLFDPFFRPEDARTRETGGTGLGLAIVKTCIEACGGTASLRNRVPHGLELTFRLKSASGGK